MSHLYHDLDKGITPLSFFFPNLPTSNHKKRDAARVKVRGLRGPWAVARLPSAPVHAGVRWCSVRWCSAWAQKAR